MIKTDSIITFKPGVVRKLSSQDRCMVTGITHGRAAATYHLLVLDGQHKDKAFTLKVRPGKSINDYAVEAKASKKEKESAQAADKKKSKERRDNESAGYQAILDMDIQPGDLVFVDIKGKRGYEFKVFEVDMNKLRIKGFPNQSNFTPGSKKGWVNMAHPEVKVTMSKKQGFDPKSDEVGQEHEKRKDAATAKRNATRGRNDALRRQFGF